MQVTLQGFKGKYKSNSKPLPVELHRRENSVLRKGKRGTFLDTSQIKLNSVNSLVTNGKRGYYPVFPMSKLYREPVSKISKLFKKLYVNGIPLLFFKDSKLISSRWFRQHLSDTIKIAESKLGDYLSKSLYLAYLNKGSLSTLQLTNYGFSLDHYSEL